jgi:predicted PurR-regulated permease PerM
MKKKLTPRDVGTGGEDGIDTLQLPAPVLRTPVDVHSASLAVLAILGVIFALQWAQSVLIPMLLGVMISYALSPLVNVMEKWHIPRVLSAAVLLLTVVGGSSYAVYSLSDDAAKLIESLPKAAQKLHQAQVKQRGEPVGAMEKVQIAAAQIEKAAIESSSPAPAVPKGVTRVQVEKPQLIIKDYLWMGTKGAIGFAVQLAMVMFLAYFIMVSGDTFRRKIVKISGPTISKQKITLRVLIEITGQIQRYLMLQLFIGILVGVLTWLAFLWIGLENAAIWGIAAGVFKTIPYIGSIIIAAGTALVAFLQFGTIDMALTVSGVSLLITSVEGYLLTPWLTGRASRMNAVVVFAGVMFWGWLWGVWGLLLGIPIIMIIKAICDRVENLQPIGELLGD